MSNNPKFMTLEDLKKREEEQKLLNNEPIDVNDIEEMSKQLSPKRGTSKSSNNVHTLDDVKNVELNRFKEQITQNIHQNKRIQIWNIIKLLIAISIAMLLVIMYVKFIDQDKLGKSKVNLLSVSVPSPSKSAFINNLLNAFVMVVMIVISTFVLFFLFYFRCDYLIKAILCLWVGLLVVFMSFVVFRNILIQFNIPFDIITGYLLLWNYAVLGIVSICWKAPMGFNQAFLVKISALAAINVLRAFNEWTIWALLIFLVFWDLIAVLCPLGPLGLLAKNLKKRQAEDPNYQPPSGLFYSTTMLWFIALETVPKSKKEKQIESKDLEELIATGNMEIEKPNGPKLGLGDFVFYSTLMGMAALYGDFNLVLGCYFVILVGFLLTLSLLVIYQKALPALPISLTLGIITFVISYFCVTPFLNKLSSDLIYF